MEERLRMLMIEALAGNERSYCHLLADVATRLRAYYARRLGPGAAVAEDLVQETLLAVHTRRFTYDPGRPFTAWLHAIARYKLIDHLRSTHSRVSVSLDDVEDDLSVQDTSEETGARIDVARLLDELAPQSRGFIRAVKIEGQSIADVAAGAGVSESAVKVAIHRGLRRLAQRLKGPDGP